MSDLPVYLEYRRRASFHVVQVRLLGIAALRPCQDDPGRSTALWQPQQATAKDSVCVSRIRIVEIAQNL